ncbi:hypothetical protein EJ110_NYTH50676 [Nymphaea thermarum]|nr:hypothetical protein EJ110_NYTH50676 [Nymphaea thermarum]
MTLGALTVAGAVNAESALHPTLLLYRQPEVSAGDYSRANKELQKLERSMNLIKQLRAKQKKPDLVNMSRSNPSCKYGRNRPTIQTNSSIGGCRSKIFDC